MHIKRDPQIQVDQARFMMVPIQSLPMMAGIGSHPMGVPGATHCDYRTMADRCPYHGAHDSI